MVMVSDDTMYAEFNCGSFDELSGFDSWNGIGLVDGCVTFCIPTGVFYSIYYGTWYKSNGSDAPTPEVSANLNASSSMLGKSPTLAKAVADSDGEYIDLTEPEVDAIRDELEGGEEDADVL
jgi:hypothetical protein